MGLLALLSVSPAWASSSLWDDGYPPQQYQSDGNTDVSFVSDVETLCNIKVPSGYTLEACELPSGHLVLPNPCGSAYHGQSFARLVCHELGHFHGWAINHPRP